MGRLKIHLIVSFLFLLILSSVVYGQWKLDDFKIRETMYHQYWSMNRCIPDQLSNYYHIIRLQFDSDKNFRDVEKILNKMVYQKYSHLANETLFWNLYMLTDFKSIFYFYASNPNPTSYYGFNIAYNTILNKYYFVKSCSIDDINDLFSTERIPLKYEAEILKYCYVILLFRNATNPIKMVAGVKDIFLQGVINYPILNHLEDSVYFDRIPISYPEITSKADSIHVSLWIARKDWPLNDYDFIKMHISLLGQTITDIKEDTIVHGFPW